MTRRCSVCDHPAVDEINRRIVDGGAVPLEFDETDNVCVES